MKELSVCVVSDVGEIREKNEDNFYLDGEIRPLNSDVRYSVFKRIECKENLVIAIFDGMGGEHYGDIASYTAASTLQKYVEHTGKGAFHFSEAVNCMNDAICQKSDNEYTKMGSTAIILKMVNDTVRICNVGDSRAYLLRNHNLTQLSRDHTLAAESESMCEKLGIKVPCIEKYSKNKLTQHLGIKSEEFILEPFISDPIDLREKDFFLLCSDGLTHMVDDDHILAVLSCDMDIKMKCEELRNEAVKAGGNDNITVALIQCNS